MAYIDSLINEDKVNFWHNRFMSLAKEISTWSRDPSSQLGAIAVKDKRVLAQGFNGFPRKIIDFPYRYENKEQKYKFIVHAEMNVIYNAAYNGVSLENSDLYIYGLPCCNECAKGIIQVGIKNVFMTDIKQDEKWLDSWEITKQMFDEVGIKYYFLRDIK